MFIIILNFFRLLKISMNLFFTLKSDIEITCKYFDSLNRYVKFVQKLKNCTQMIEMNFQ